MTIAEYKSLQNQHIQYKGPKLHLSMWKRSYDIQLEFKGEKFEVGGIGTKLYVRWGVDGGRHFIYLDWSKFKKLENFSDKEYCLDCELIWIPEYKHNNRVKVILDEEILGIRDVTACEYDYLNTPIKYHFWGGGFRKEDEPTPCLQIGC